MVKAEEHPLYVGEIAGLPTYWDCDDLGIEGLHLRQVRKDDEYDFYNSEDGECTILARKRFDQYRILLF